MDTIQWQTVLQDFTYLFMIILEIYLGRWIRGWAMAFPSRLGWIITFSTYWGQEMHICVSELCPHIMVCCLACYKPLHNPNGDISSINHYIVIWWHVFSCNFRNKPLCMCFVSLSCFSANLKHLSPSLSKYPLWHSVCLNSSCLMISKYDWNCKWRGRLLCFLIMEFALIIINADYLIFSSM